MVHVAMAMAELGSALSSSRLSVSSASRIFAFSPPISSTVALQQSWRRSPTFAGVRARRERRASALLELVPAHVSKQALNFIE
jgi:hypothetical protein